MYRIGSEEKDSLEAHNIRITQLEPSSSMSNPDPTTTHPPRKVIHLPKVRMLSRGRAPPAIRITNVKSIRPPDPDFVKRREEERLRAQLQKEIVSRSRACAYTRYPCTLPVLSGRRHCVRHVLADASAPYRRCVQDRCTMPARDTDEHGMCYEHARAAMLARARAAAPPPPVTTAEALLSKLSHYALPRQRTTSGASTVSVVSEGEEEPTPGLDPFKQIDAPALNASVSSALMECASASDSDGDSVTLGVGGSCRAPWIDDMEEPEDAPCEEYPLWHAGVFTVEEAAGEARRTLRALQSAYIRQMGRLKVLLMQARQRYLKDLKAEREQYCSIWSQALTGQCSARERRQLRKLRALSAHRRRHGAGAVLARKLHRRRAKANDPPSTRPLPPGARCTFSEGGVRCPHHSLPAARHCLKHVLHDGQQVLFSACGDCRGGVPCREPLAKLPAPAGCRYHCDAPAYTVFTLKKDGSDSDTDSHSSAESHLTQGTDAEPRG